MSAFWRDRRVLLTGHTGFKGAWLALWLAHLGARVTGVAGPPPTAPSLFEIARVADAVEHVEADVLDAEAMRDAVTGARPEVVIHMAAQALVRRGLADPVGTFAVNVLGTAHVLDAVRTAGDGVRAVVCVTSDKCYRNREWEWAYREEDPLGGRDPYSSSKACQELVAGAFRDSLLAARGVRVATARAGNVIGGGDWAGDRLVPDLIRAAVAGEPLLVRSPAAVRPWQHVLNPLDGYLALAERLCGDDGEEWATAWNFGPAGEDARPVRWVVERLAERWGEALDIRWGAGEAAEAGRLELDSARARRRLGWAPRWDLAAGLDATVSWYDHWRCGGDARALTLEQIKAFSA